MTTLMNQIPMMGGGQPVPDLIVTMASEALVADAIDRDKPFGLVMLNPVKLHPELFKEGMELNDRPEANSGLLMYIPTSDADKLLLGYVKDEETGLLARPDDLGEVLYAKAVKDYVLLGEDAKAITTAAGKSGAWDVIPARHRGVMLKQDIAIHVDLPAFAEVAKKVEETSPNANEDVGAMLGAFFGEDSESAAGGITIGEDGYALDLRVAPKADSAMAKMLASPLKGKGLDLQRLPKIPVVAMYSFSQPEVQAGESPMKAIMELARTDTPDGESMGGDPDVNMLLNFLSTFTDNAQSGAIVFGMGPGSVMTFNGLLQTENSAEMLQAIEKATIQLAKDVKASDDPDVNQATFEYKANAETIDGQAIHHLTFDEPDMQEDAEEVKRLLGEEKIIVRLAAPDLKTVVLTLGGKDAMMKEALAAAAKGKSGFLAEEATQQVLKDVPNKAYGTVLVQPSTVADLIAGIFQVNPADMGMAMKFKKVPLAVGWGPQGQDMQIAGVAPIDSLVDGAQAFQMFFMGMMTKAMQEGNMQVDIGDGSGNDRTPPPPPPPAEDIPPANDF
jgi:hypothetical protein